MKRVIGLLAVLLVALPACFGGRTGYERPRQYSGGSTKPPPTKIKFFNFTDREFVVKKKGDVKFKADDGTDDDIYGDDEPSLDTTATVTASGTTNDIVTKNIPEPTDKGDGVPTPDIDVKATYQTVTYWVTAADKSDATKKGTCTFSVPTGGDIKGPQTMKVTFQTDPDDDTKTTMQVNARYWNGSKWKNANDSCTIQH